MRSSLKYCALPPNSEPRPRFLNVRVIDSFAAVEHIVDTKTVLGDQQMLQIELTAQYELLPNRVCEVVVLVRSRSLTAVHVGIAFECGR